MTTIIKANNLKKSFKKRVVWEDVTLNIQKGIYGMLGPNGSGKTTLIRCLLGLYPLDKGTIEKSNVSIGYLPQRLGLFNEMKVYDMMYFFATLKKIPKNERKAEIMKALEFVNMDKRSEDQISKLSGGMQRRIGIAQAILGTPELIIFDEPTVGLDPEERSRFKEMIVKLGEHSAVIFSTHILEDIEEVCNSYIIMCDDGVRTFQSLDEITEYAGKEVKSVGEAYARIVHNGEN